MKKGIVLIGNILTDNVKMVGSYPEKGMLSTIESESLAVGGCVPNTAIDLKKIDPKLNVKVYGRVGNDYKGEYVVGYMNDVGIDTSCVKVSTTAPTSYSDVMTIIGTGERTFFHNRGANKEFSPADVDIESLDCNILHAGYLMLLDSFDKINSDGTTPMSEFLKSVQEKGIKTSIDLVSESSGNFNKIATASLPYCDYVIINEIEAGTIVGINARESDGTLNESNVKLIMEKLMAFGIKESLIIHCPEKGFLLNHKGRFTKVDSVKLPKGFIKGSVGAGDAFCAGCLYSLYNGYSPKETLKFANLVAINCLSEADSVSGVKNKEKLVKILDF